LGGPSTGRASRLGYGDTVGRWNFSQVTADYRRDDRVLGPIVLASRLLYFGRIGQDAEQFRIYAGSNDMIRGMVDNLAARLEKSPNDENGWLRLMSSRMTLGEKDAAKAALAKARAAFTNDADATARLTSAARELGIVTRLRPTRFFFKERGPHGI